MLEPLQLRGGVDAELLGEPVSHRPQRGQGVRLPSAAVLRQRQQGREPLAEGVLLHLRSQLQDGAFGMTQVEQGLPRALRHGGAQLDQAGPDRGH